MMNGDLKTLKNQRGITLVETLLSVTIGLALIAAITSVLRESITARDQSADGARLAQYINGVAAYMASQGAVAPATLTRDGTDWLKSVDCGGLQPADNYFLPCNIPNDFNGDYGLGQPRVVFDWSEPRVPEAAITFGVVQRSDGNADPVTAATLVQEINSRLNLDGFQFAEAFIIDPTIVDGVVASAEVQQANLRAFVDLAIESTNFVRLDGNSIMRGTLVNENDSWAMIARDANGVEIADPINPAASTNVNDTYIRSVDAWASETHELAEEAYRVAIRAPIFVSNVRSGAIITKPTCPAPLVERISAVPAGFVGGPAPNDPRYVAGARTRVTDNGASYTVFLDVLYDGESMFQTVPAPPDPASAMGLVNVTIKCSDA